MTLLCEKCVYYDTDQDEQPCCSCVEGVNFELDKGEENMTPKETAKEIIKLARYISAKVRKPLYFTCSDLEEKGEKSNKMQTD